MKNGQNLGGCVRTRIIINYVSKSDWHADDIVILKNRLSGFFENYYEQPLIVDEFEINKNEYSLNNNTFVCFVGTEKTIKPKPTTDNNDLIYKLLTGDKDGAKMLVAVAILFKGGYELENIEKVLHLQNGDAEEHLRTYMNKIGDGK